MVTACSTFTEEFLYPSPVLLAQLLRLRLRQLEDPRNNTNLEGEWMSIFSTRSTTNPSERKMERNQSKPWDPHHTRTWVIALPHGHLRTGPTVCLYPGDREGQHSVQSCQPLAGTLMCVQLMWRSPIPQGEPTVSWTVRPNYWPKKDVVD